MYAEVHASETPAAVLADARGIIISGGPSSVYDPGSPAVDPGIFAIAPLRHEPAEGVALELEQLHEIASTMPERIKRVVPFCGTVGLRFT